jgi:hypothetical protein
MQMDYNSVKLMKLSRDNSIEDLLDAALDGHPKTVDAVSELYLSVVRVFGRDTESDVSKKFWQACGTFLANAGVTKEQLTKMRRPYPVAGEAGFRSVLDEFREQGWDV